MKKTAVIVSGIMMVLVVCAGYAWADITDTSLGTDAGTGGTLGYDTYIGNAAGHNGNTSSSNTAVGYAAGFQGGYNNTSIGVEAGLNGANNTSVGGGAGGRTTGSSNSFLGVLAGAVNDTGYANSFFGFNAGFANTSGVNNTYVGASAGYSNQTGSYNVFIGYAAGYSETGSNKLYIDNCPNGSPCSNPFIEGDFSAKTLTVNGSLTTSSLSSTGIIQSTTGGIKFPDGSVQTSAFIANTSSSSNTTIGYQADTVGGTENTSVGYNAGQNGGQRNTTIGYQANTVGGTDNTSVGFLAGQGGGSYNTSFGFGAGNGGAYNTSVGLGAGVGGGNNNTSIGYHSGNSNVGTGSVFLGYQAGYTETNPNRLYIDNCYGFNSTTMTSCPYAPLIYGEFDNRVVNINGTLMMTAVATPSDERLKKNIEPLQKSLERVMSLRGVSYDWKSGENEGRRFGSGKQIGLIAQEVEAVIPELVLTDSKGYKALQYDKLVPVLVEAIKEQQKTIADNSKVIAEQKKIVTELQNALRLLTERLEKLDRLEARLNKLESKDMSAQK